MQNVFQKFIMAATLVAGAEPAMAQPAIVAAPVAAHGVQEASPVWEKLPSIPDPDGFAGAFAGASNGALIVAGGANFPEKKPWDGGVKQFYDTIFVLDRAGGEWHAVGKLPRAMAYGTSIDIDQGLLCIGGNDAKQNYADVFLLEWVDGKLKKTDWPPLQQPLTMAVGARLGTTIFLACGNAKNASGADEAQASLWSLDLSAKPPAWQHRDDMPGPTRAQAVAAVQDGSFFVISGVRSDVGADGKPKIDYLSDAYRYTQTRNTGTWKRIADLPHPNAASPTPAPAIGNSKILLLGEGAQGKNLQIPMKDRPLLARTCLMYDTRKDQWGPADEIPFAVVCASVVEWNGKLVVVNGEIRGGIRTPEVWVGTLSAK